MLDKQTKEATLATYAEKLLVKHVAYPDEVAEAYVFLMKYVFDLFTCGCNVAELLLLSRCKYITGQRIDVDGGVELI